MPQTPDLHPEGSRRLTDEPVGTVRRIGEESVAPLETSLRAFAAGGRRLEVRIGPWTTSVFPGADEVIAGFRTLDDEPVSEEWFRGQARALMQRGYKPVGGAESVDARTGELFGGRITGLIGRPVRTIDATPASNPDTLGPG